MPTTYIKKLADEGKGSVQSLEKKWNHAKSLAKDAGHDEEFDYITGIFNKMIKESKHIRESFSVKKLLAELHEAISPSSAIHIADHNGYKLMKDSDPKNESPYHFRTKNGQKKSFSKPGIGLPSDFETEEEAKTKLDAHLKQNAHESDSKKIIKNSEVVYVDHDRMGATNKKIRRDNEGKYHVFHRNWLVSSHDTLDSAKTNLK